MARAMSMRRQAVSCGAETYSTDAPGGASLHGYNRWHSRCWTMTMALKPNGLVCNVREQIVEDSASGLILQFECAEGCLRLVIAGESLPFGNRELIFDLEGREAAVGTLVGEFRRPSWLRKVG
jgi:hypothetical protein